MKGRLLVRLLSLVVVLVTTFASFAPVLAAPSAASASSDPRYFAPTGFRIDNDQFWNYFQTRGGINNFGYPVSRTFQFMGKTVQFFQRRVLELNPDGSVGQLNLLDNSIMPYTAMNGANFPATNASLTKSAPATNAPNYATGIIAWIQQNAPNTFNGQPVNFDNTFNNTVTLSEAYPNGGGNANWLPDLDLEMWGVPLSAPAVDPNNHNFIYQRYQRGIMMYNAGCQCTQGVLLGDYLKSIITGNNLPGDLAAQAQNSPFYKQYNNSKPNGLNNPTALPNTNMTNAFEAEAPVVAATPATAAPATAPQASSGFHYGFQIQGYGVNQQQVMNDVTGAGFGWIKQQVQWATVEPNPGSFNFGTLDSLVNIAQASHVNVLFSVVDAPSWAAVPNGAFPKDPSQFASFMSTLATHFKGRVQAYEIWNEENFAREVGPGNINAGNYVELLKAAYPAIKAADPNAIVVSGAPTPTGVNDPNIAERDITYLQQMYQYQGGIVKNYFDVLGAHNEPYWNPPNQTVATATNTSYANDPSFFFRQVEDYHNLMVQMGDGNKPIWETEIGYDSNPEAPSGYSGWTVSPQQQATYLVQLFQYARANYPWLGAIFVWNLNFQQVVPQTDEKWGFGVLNPDGTPRPAYSALASMPKT